MESQQRPVPITGKEGGPIELNIAAQWTRNHRERNPNDTISQFFGREILTSILDQDECLGIRIYYANDQKLNGWQKFWVAVSNFLLSVVANIGGKKHLIITGVIADGSDQLPEHDEKTASPDAGHPHLLTTSQGRTKLGDQSYPCPGSTGCPSNALTNNK